MRRQGTWLGVSTLAAGLLWADPLWAYCRSMTCNIADPGDNCERDANGCVVTGRPLQWASACVSFSVHERGSELRGIDQRAAADVIASAFDRWMLADCGGRHPSLNVAVTAQATSCSRVGYEESSGNANVWAFRDSDWPHSEQALAVTTVTFDPESGAILDADVELNSAAELTLGDESVAYDFAAIAQHEAGHFIGLSHSALRTATMWYRTRYGSIDGRTLDPDDEHAACAAYPPDRERSVCDFAPRNGWSDTCPEQEAAGCGTAGPRASGAAGGWLMLVAFLLSRRVGGRRLERAPRARAS